VRHAILNFIARLLGHSIELRTAGAALDSITDAHDEFNKVVNLHSLRLAAEQEAAQIALDYFAGKLAAITDMRSDVDRMLGPERNDP
jgi:hypothetical protein